MRLSDQAGNCAAFFPRVCRPYFDDLRLGTSFASPISNAWNGTHVFESICRLQYLLTDHCSQFTGLIGVHVFDWWDSCFVLAVNVHFI